jgi:ABC-2 type transport system ATP-binding protein
VHDPPVLILDEPTVGLDPVQIGEIRGLIRDLASGSGDSQHTVVLSTHIMAEVSAICRRVILINEGHKRVDASLDDLAREGRSLESLFARETGSETPVEAAR